MKHYIYKITNLLNNKIYIGQTNNFNLRIQQHKSAAKHKAYALVDKIIKKYGIDNFTYSIIETCDSQAEANYQEIWNIFIQCSLVAELGYNIALGGNKLIHTSEMKKKISTSLKKYYKTHKSKWFGKKHSQKSKIIMSKISIGKSGTNKNKKFSEEWKTNLSKSLKGRQILSSRKFSKEIEQEICDLYLKKISTVQLEKKYNCSRSIILNILHRNNVKIRTKQEYNSRKMFSNEEELKICEEYKSGTKRKEIASKFGCSIATVRNVLLKNKYIVKGNNNE